MSRSRIPKASLRLVTRIPLSFFDRGCSFSVLSLHFVCRLQQKVSEYGFDLGVNGKGQIFLEISLVARNAHSSFIFE